ncbi:uncharacterized protein C8Q71DRAFT_78139 [Rhodofomes roseus]|uniref:Uncharacterized protein n=1 Tax=Rhodofomes roseus TaxID=34475 RepID=A0ABQ8KFC4_9APHY|nr:uncharacterized protein C8Q71DRAFT_78139 [Rhodofomes roseus]KAH9836343.1 hypothetical protein C8Q71DRAFT_78139 [Rhodofomes roseus]
MDWNVFQTSSTGSAVEHQSSDPDENAAVPVGVIAEPTEGDNANVHEYAQEGTSGSNKLQPTSPDSVLMARYKHRHCLGRDPLSSDIDKIPPMTSSCQPFQPPVSISPWAPQGHPEGQRYFTKLINDIRYHTDHYFEDEASLNVINELAAALHSDLRKHPNLPADIEVVLHVFKNEQNEMECSYYLASEAERSVFWLEEVDTTLITENFRPVRNASYLKYREHVDLYPHGRIVTAELLSDVNETLNTFAFDTITSITSTSPWDYSELQKILSVSRNIAVGAGAQSIWVLARIKTIILWERFVNMHGLREARLERHRSVFDQSPAEPSCLLRLISPMFFNLPLQYLRELEKIYVDRTVNYKSWSMFVTNLQSDWGNSITPATVLLTANVGLLAIQSVDTGNPDRSVAQIASYVSTFLSLGNIMLCTILAQRHRLNANMTADLAGTYVDGRANFPYGLELVAVSFSLPSVMFLWGLAAFYVAVAWVCLEGTSLWTRLLSGFIFAMITVCIGLIVVFDFWATKRLRVEPAPRKLDRVAYPRQLMRDAWASVLGASSVVRKTRCKVLPHISKRKKRATEDQVTRRYPNSQALPL